MRAAMNERNEGTQRRAVSVVRNPSGHADEHIAEVVLVGPGKGTVKRIHLWN